MRKAVFVASTTTAIGLERDRAASLVIIEVVGYVHPLLRSSLPQQGGQALFLKPARGIFADKLVLSP